MDDGASARTGRGSALGRAVRQVSDRTAGLEAPVLAGVHDRLQRATMRTARTAQAAVITGLDACVGATRGAGDLVGRALRAPHGLATLVVGRPADVVDDHYLLLTRLLALHREFAQRLFEVLDREDDDADAADDPRQVDPRRSHRMPSDSDEPGGGRVIPLRRPGA